MGFVFMMFLVIGERAAYADPASGPGAPGQLISADLIVHYSRKMLDLAKRSSASTKELPASRNGVDLFRITYLTSPVSGGDLVPASGLVILPDGVTASSAVVSYQHGTTASREEVPSRPRTNPEAIALELVFGSMGDIVVAADGLGLGDSPGLHPFLHARTEASSAADLLQATDQFLRNRRIQAGGKLFLLGYSQGGHATLALQRFLEQEHAAAPWALQGVVPMAGPYDLSTSALEGTLGSTSPRAAYFAAYLIFSMSRIYGTPATLAEAVVSPWEQRIPSLYDGFHSGSEILPALPASAPELLQKGFLEGALRNPGHPFRESLRANDVFDFKPSAPVHLIHARGDRDVPFRCSEVAFARMKELGGVVDLVELGGELDHVSAVIPAMLHAARWIEARKSLKN